MQTHLKTSNEIFGQPDFFEKDQELHSLFSALQNNHTNQSTNHNQAAEGGLLSEILGFKDAEEQKNYQERFMLYLEDLRQVLETPAGLRVLRQWLDAAQAFSSIWVESNRIYANAALMDFARERMAEIALASPLGHVKVQLAGAVPRK